LLQFYDVSLVDEVERSEGLVGAKRGGVVADVAFERGHVLRIRAEDEGKV